MTETKQPAQYKELLKMRRVFIATYGEKQLKEDYEMVMNGQRITT